MNSGGKTQGSETKVRIVCWLRQRSVQRALSDFSKKQRDWPSWWCFRHHHVVSEAAGVIFLTRLWLQWLFYFNLL